MSMVQRFRDQARACADLGSPMYAELLGRVADDIERHGVSAAVLEGHEDDPGPSALALRLAGSVHRMVLEGRAEELAAFYPSAGGTWDLAAAWPAFERVLRDQCDEVRARLEHPPQTNEVGRAAALMGGLLRLGETCRLPLRLFEIGSSGGLNLRADRFGYTDEADRLFGDEASPLVLRGAWRGRSLCPWPDMEIVERAGCDKMPVDVTTAEGRLALTSFVWPDQAERLARLRDALAVAERHPAEVREQDARSFVEGMRLLEGTTTVLWHSVVWQYIGHEDREAIRDRIGSLGASATEDMPFAHLFLEPTRRTPDSDHEFLVVLERWPGGERRFLGAGAPHGLPTVWE